MSDSLQPYDCSPPGSSVHGISKQEYWSGLPCPLPGDLPNPGIEPASLRSPVFAGRLFISSAAWEALEEAWTPANPSPTSKEDNY